MRIRRSLQSIWRYLNNSDYRFLVNDELGLNNFMSDESYLRRKYHVLMNKELDLHNPRTFNEKLQWLKLHNRKNEYTMMVDKYRVRDYVKNKIGNEYLIPLLGTWDSPDDIDFDVLPNRFVLKCNHNSGLGMCICKDKSKLNIEKVKTELRKGFVQNYYLTGREWPYKNVTRKIICEQYITDTPESNILTDYKFFCFNGVVDCVMLCLDRDTGNPKYYFFNEKWELCRYNIRGEQAQENFTLPKPMYIDKMFEISRELSQGLPYARIDLYNANLKIYFGEITFFPASGFDANLLLKTDEYFGKLIDLEKIIQ